MLLLAALLAAPPAATAELAPVTPYSADEIVVRGKRMTGLNRLRMDTRVDRKTGRTDCVFKRRSGDVELDAAVCAVTLGCAAKAQTVQAMQSCMAPAMDALVRGETPG